jgi:hypothetical protein
MTRQPPAVRFQAEQSNALWHFDMSPSDLKQLATPPWIDPDRSGAPTLMLFSVVDRSGVAYQEYRCVYGEDVEAALRFLFAAMSRKADEADPFQGIPAVLYLDNGPASREIGSVQAGDGKSRCRGDRPHAGWQRRPADHGAFQGQGRASISHGEGRARDALGVTTRAVRSCTTQKNGWETCRREPVPSVGFDRRRR